MSYGLLPTGFNRMRLPEIREAILADLKTRTGLDFDPDPRTLTGQFISVFAEREAAIWEIAEAVYSAMYPPSAFDNALDDAVSFVGVRRIPAAKTQVPVILYGAAGTVIPVNSVARSTQSFGNYLLAQAVTIGASKVADVIVNVVTAVNSFVYSVIVDGVARSYTSDGSATLAEIRAGLAAALAATGYTITQTGTTIRIVDPNVVGFSVSLSANLSLGAMGSPGIMQRQETGPEAPPVGTLTRIVSTVDGWDSLNNPVDASPGRAEETDAELRSRYRLGVFRTGAATISAVEANLLENVPGVTYARVYTNNGNTTDSDGRPAHSVEAVVSGGTNKRIFEELLAQVAAGIQTYGNTSGIIKDSQGTNQTIAFSRPTVVTAWLKVDVTTYPEEILPGNAAATIAQVVAATGNSFGVGKDVILQRFLGPIFAAVPGLVTISVEVATGASSPGTYSSSNLAIGIRSISQWDANRVTVTIT